MRLLTLLPDRSRRAVELAAEKPFEVRHEVNSVTLHHALESSQWNTVILDPTLLADDVLRSIVGAAHGAGCSILLLAPYAAHITHRVIIAARESPLDVLCSDFEADRRLLRLKLGAFDLGSANGLLLHALSLDIRSLRRPLELGVVRLFGQLPLPHTVQAFADSVPIDRRTLDRAMRKAGIQSTVSLLREVRIAWAWDFLRASAFRDVIGRVAARCGYASSNALRLHARTLLGLSPSALSETVPSATLIERLRDYGDRRVD
jgi:AraC-like DNA-binding protein